jgi:ATP-dependent DNA helicase PIF1
MENIADIDIESMPLSGEQKTIVRYALTGKSFFFTGAAGSGKSHLLRQLVQSLRLVYDHSEIHVTAPTGIGSLCAVTSPQA